VKDKGLANAVTVVIFLIIVLGAIGGIYLVQDGEIFGSETGDSDFEVSYDTPEDTINTIYNAYNARDAKTAYESLSEEAKQDTPIEELKEDVRFHEEAEATYEVDVDNVEKDNGTATVEGTVKVTSIEDDGVTFTDKYSDSWDLVKENGEWKID